MCDEQRKLIQALVTGDTRATEEFIFIWHPRIYQWIYRHSWLRPVEDVAQEVWYHLLDHGWERLLGWEGLYRDSRHRHSLESYLRTITINKARDIERRSKRRLPPADEVLDIVDDGPVGTDPAVEAERARVREIFDSCFQRAQERDQINLVMWREGRSDADIAERLGIEPNNAAQRRYQALRRLRDCLRDKMSEYLDHA